MMTIASPSDFRAAARKRLPPFLFEYIDGAAYDEATAARNISDLAAIALRQRVLTDVSKIDLSARLFGRDYHMPVGLGPVGLSGMFARRGEAQAAQAAAAKNIPFCLSTVSVCALDEVKTASPDPIWFQLYMVKDRGFMRDLLHQAKAAGCSALIFTVDLPMPGVRYRDSRSGMSGPNAGFHRFLQALSHPRWAWDVGLRGKPHNLGNFAPLLKKGSGLGDYVGWISRNFDPGLTWTDIAWIREHWDGPIIIKGILDPADALEAAKAGADGIVVSNHGGRQLDGVLSTARALPAISDTMGDRFTILVDGGIRSGLDAVRMLALGADGVLLGRAWAYALGAAGGGGVTQLLDFIEAEMRIAMALTGSTDVSHLGRHILADFAPPR